MSNVYVTSHLDGDLEALKKMIEKINLTEDDDLYVIGGIFSTKNKPVTTILEFIRTKNNIHYLPNEIDVIYRNFCHASSMVKNNVNPTFYEEKKIYYKEMIKKKCGPKFADYISMINKKEENEFPNWNYLRNLKEEQIIYVNGNLYLLTAGAPVKDEKDKEELMYKRVTEIPKNNKYFITTEAGRCIDFVATDPAFQCMKDELDELNQRSVTIITASIPTYKICSATKIERPMPIIDIGHIIYINTGYDVAEEISGFKKALSVLDLTNNKIIYTK